MATAQFRDTIPGPWISIEPVRVGKLPAGLGTPDRYVVVEDGKKLLRIDVYLSRYECGGPFEEVAIWGEFVLIGCCEHVFLVPLHGGKVTTIELDGYFGHLWLHDDVLLVASQDRLFRLSRTGELIWTTGKLGIDGVVVDRLQDGIVYGQGEWDPPGGWKRFAIRLDSGEFVP